MNELIKVNVNEQGMKVVSGRDLHKGLGVKTQYTKWMERMIDYGFEQSVDYEVLVKNDYNLKGGRPETDHVITLDMAKEISMIQRTDIGRQFRKYFIECEKQLIEITQAPQITREQLIDQAMGRLIRDGGTFEERIELMIEVREYHIEKGEAKVCDNGVITLPLVVELIRSHLHVFLKEKVAIITSTHFTNFLKVQGYLDPIRFPMQDGKGLESRAHAQPNINFHNTFVNQGMAVVREIPDGRGKLEIKYTKKIEKFICSDEFKRDFLKYLGFNRIEETNQ